MSDARAFLGTGWAFPPRFDAVPTPVPAGQPPVRVAQAGMVSAEEDIRQSLLILLGTTPGERLMQPAYGCGVRRLVYEVLNESLLTEVRHLIEKAILFFEARIDVEDVHVNADEWHAGLLRVRIDYRVRRTNSRNNLVYPLYFREGTGVHGARHA